MIALRSLASAEQLAYAGQIAALAANARVVADVLALRDVTIHGTDGDVRRGGGAGGEHRSQDRRGAGRRAAVRRGGPEIGGARRRIAAVGRRPVAAVYPTDVDHSVERIVHGLAGPIDPVQVSADVNRGARVGQDLTAAGAIGQVPAMAALHSK